jgi:hypothetical protein
MALFRLLPVVAACLETGWAFRARRRTRQPDCRVVDDRAVWAPLLALAMVADVEAGGDRAERLLLAARELSEAREADDEAGSAARLITALQRISTEVGTTLTPAELLESLKARGFSWLKSPRGLAGLMAPFGLVAKRGREGTRVVRRYPLDPGALADLASRYRAGGQPSLHPIYPLELLGDVVETAVHGPALVGSPDPHRVEATAPSLHLGLVWPCLDIASSGKGVSLGIIPDARSGA